MDQQHDSARATPDHGATGARAAARTSDTSTARPRKQRIVAKILIPLVIAIVCLTAYSVVVTWQMDRRKFHLEIRRELTETRERLQLLLDHDTLRLRAALDVFVQDDEFKKVFRAGDRDALFEHGRPLLRRLKKDSRITQIHFIRPDGTCFVRLHDRDKYDDTITGSALEQAMQTGEAASAIELGKSAFALRVVRPYYDGDELIGYVEFAEELSTLLSMLADAGERQIVLLVDKQHLDRANWESIAHDNPGLTSWDEFEDVVVAHSTFHTLPAEVRSLISHEREQAEDSGRAGGLARIGRKTFGTGRLPLCDAREHQVADVLVMADVTSHFLALNTTVRSQVLAGAIITIALVGLFFRSLRRTQQDLTNSSSSLEHHSTRLHESLDREKQVSDILAAVLAEPALDKVLRLLADSARQMTGAELGVIILLDRDSGAMGNITPSNFPLDIVPQGTVVKARGALGALARAKDVVRLDDVMAHPAFTGFPEWHPEIRALLSAPLRDDGGVLGLFALGHTDPARRFTEDHKALFATVSRLATVAIRRAAFHEDLQTLVCQAQEASVEAQNASIEARLARVAAERQAAETVAAYDELMAVQRKLAAHTAILQAAGRTVKLDETLRSVLDTCVEQLGFDNGSIYLVDPLTDELLLRHARGVSEPFIEHMRRIPAGAPMRPDAAAREVQFFDKRRLNEHFAADAEFLAEGLAATATVPLAAGGKFLGLLALGSHTDEDIGPESRDVLAGLTHAISPAIANALQAEDLERFNRAAAGREDRVIEMKLEVNDLLVELGRQRKYKVTHEQLAPHS